MKQIFKKISLLVMTLVMLFAFSLISGCTDKEPEFVNRGEVGTYYAYDAENSTFTLDQNKFTLAGATSLTGTYTFDGTNLAITFDGDASAVSVKFENGDISFTYKGTSYMFYGDREYTVKFDGTTIADKAIKNGSKCEKPADPVKEGYTFINWYKDKKFGAIYNFDSEIITADTTIYARFEANTDAKDEYTVNFVTGVDGVTVDSVTTFHNTLFTLPEVNVAGKTFLGWWVSSYNDANKLSYQYQEMMDIEQNITLYAVFQDNAPAVSYADGRITWDNKGVNKQYAINVIPADTDEASVEGVEPIFTKRVQTNYVDFDFEDYDAGNYIIEVQCGDYTGKSYYANKALAQVCKISVDGFKVTWNEVPNATMYYITVECGDSNHEHEMLLLGDVTEYDFSACTMPADGINFTIYAAAQGYMTSESATVNDYKELAKVNNIKLDVADGKQVITWDAVANVSSYVLKLVDANGQKYNVATETNSYDVTDFYGNISASVTPVLLGYYGHTSSQELNKTKLTTPKNITLNGYEVKWDAVDDAVSYNITVGTLSFTSNTNSYLLTAEECESISDFKITVQAVAAEEVNNSFVSPETLVNKEGVTSIAYANGVITWNSVAGVTKYAVKINDNDVVVVEGQTSYEYAIPSGNNTISVTTADSTGKYNSTFDCTYVITAYSINFNVGGGVEIASVSYAKGDTIAAFAQAEREGYDFVGWYCADEEGKSTGELFTETTYNYDKDITVIAGWTGHVFNVTLDYDAYGTGETSSTVKFLSNYTLPTPTQPSALKAFVGWYTGLNGQGIQCTDQYGQSVGTWKFAYDITLHAYWADVFTFNLINEGAAYSVEKGLGISYVSEVTVPVTYEGKPVTTIEASGFQSCTSLVIINIPETIVNVEVGSAGPNGTGSCFQYCSKLEAVNVYKVDGTIAEDIKYYSVDGVLIYKNEITGTVEIKYFPYNTKGGTYTIPSTVTSIPQNAFKSCSKITELIIPATVTEIGEGAFYGCSKITTVTFLEAEEGTAEQSISIAKNAFQSCSALEVINLPARLDSFSTDIFTSCSKLREVNIVGYYEDVKYKTIDGILYSIDGTELLYCPRAYVCKGEENSTTFTIPVGVTKIGSYAFGGTSSSYAVKTITAIVISGQVTTIAEGAFRYCTLLETVTFNGTATDAPLTIETLAFGSCTGLTEISLPANLKVLKKNAFASASNLTKVNVYAVSAEINFETGAFGTVVTSGGTGTYYVTDVYLSKDVHAFDITGVFGGSKLANVVVDAENANYTSIDNVLYDKDVTSIVYYPLEKEGNYTIPSTITHIGDGVFTGRYISSITIPNTVTVIGNGAFTNCKNLLEVIFETGGTETLVIEDNAFYGCSYVTSFNLPTRLRSIGSKSFYSCSSLTSIVLPEGLTSLAEFAFQSCTKITSISIPSTLVNIAETTSTLTNDKEARVRAFDGTSSNAQYIVAEANPTYASIDGILYKKIKNAETGVVESLELISCPQGKAGSITLPNNISKIDNHAFYYCDELTEVKVASGYTGEVTIGNYAFYYCKLISTIEIPQGVKSIGTYAIYSCQGLTSIVIPNTVTYMGRQSIYYCNSLETVTFAEGGTEALTFEDGTTSNIYGPFASCSKLKTVVLPDRLTRISDYCFYGLSALENVNIPNSVTAIGDRAFYNCQALTNLTIDSTASQLATLGSYVFYYCPITSFVMPNTVTTIGSDCFYYAKQLQNVTLSSELTAIPTYAFYQTSSLTSITIPANSKITEIGNYAFGYSKITSFVIPQMCETIGSYAFTNCKQLASITFETKEVVENAGTADERTRDVASIKSIGDKAFAQTIITSFAFPYCGLDSAGKPNTITLGSSTVELFSSCKYLTTVYISESVVSLDKLFNKCSSITSVVISEDSTNFTTYQGKPIIMDGEGKSIVFIYGRQDGVFDIPSGVISISDYAFSGQTNITKITIPSSVLKIGKYAFQNCVSLEEVVFDSNCLIEASNLGTYTFAGCRNLKKVVLPSALTAISDYMFLSCTSLTDVTLPTSLEKIGAYAFDNCYSLETLNIPSTVTTIGNYAFARTAFKSFTFNKDVTYGTYLLAGDTDLTSVTFDPDCDSLGNYTFQDCTGLTEVTLAKIPATVPTYLFDGCTNLTKVTLFTNSNATATKNIISTGMFADCSNLEEVIIPEGFVVTQIGASAFINCSKLASFTIPSTVTSIGDKAFRDTALTSVVIPASVTTIGTSTTSITATSTTYNYPNIKDTYRYGAFEGCKYLTTVDMSNATSLATIGACAFEGCSALTSITIPSKVTKIYSCCLANCTSLTSITVEGSISTWGNLFAADCPNLTSVTINDNTKTMPGYGFMNDTSLVSFAFPDKATTTGAGTFQNCTALTTISHWPTSTLTSLGGYLFQGCTSLKEVKIPSTNTKVTSSGGYMFYGCTSLETVELPATVKTLNNYTFYDCTSLKSYNISETVTTITTKCFYNTGLTSINIPKSVVAISGAAFNGCANLTNVTIDPANTTFTYQNGAIVKNAVGTALPTIVSVVNAKGDYVIPEGVTITSYAFSGCDDVTSVTLPLTMTSVPSYAFTGFNGKKIILSDNTTGTGSYSFSECGVEEVENTENLTAIGYGAFKLTPNLNSVELGDSLLTLGTSAFESSNISSISLPASVTTVGMYAFRYCNNLSSVTLNEGLTTINTYAFYQSGIKSIVIPESVNTLGNYAFYGCTELETVEFKKAYATIPSYAFYGCTKLANVNIPEGVTEIGTHAFELCESLKSITLPSSLVTINTNAFAGAGLETLTVPENVKNIFAYAFADCANLKTVSLNEGLETLGVVATTLGTSSPNGYVFQNCANLESINIPTTLDSIGCNTFENCTKLMTLYIPNNVQMVGGFAFAGWTSSQRVLIQASLFEVTGSWYDAISVLYAQGYWSNTDAQLVFEYVENN